MGLSDRLQKVLATKYRLESLVGTGGMGVVYAARHLRTEHRVAIKFLREEVLRDDELRRRFMLEAKAVANLSHPNIVRVLDFDEDDAYGPYIILELLDGESLAQQLRERGPQSPEQALSVLVPIMHALDYAHAERVLHRDVKPANIFLHRESDGRATPKLLDFGIVRLLDVRSGLRTRPSAPPGTPIYMAPEQAHGSQPLSPATDVWSMGVTVYECLTGRAPFENDRAERVFAAVLAGEYEPLQERLPHLPTAAALQRAIAGALASDPAQRTPSMYALMQALCSAARIDPSALIPEHGAWASTALGDTLAATPVKPIASAPAPPAAVPTKPLRQRSNPAPPAQASAPAATANDRTLNLALITLATLIALLLAGLTLMRLREPASPPPAATATLQPEAPAPTPPPQATPSPDAATVTPAPDKIKPQAPPRRRDDLDLGEILVDPK
jgi:serine/threonine-protein kinase